MNQQAPLPPTAPMKPTDTGAEKVAEGEALPLMRRLWSDHLQQHKTKIALTLIAIVGVAVSTSTYPLLINWAFSSLAERSSWAISTLPWLVLAPALGVFHRQHPRINVTVHDVVNEQVIDMVRQRQVEMGIAFEPEATGSLHFTPLFHDRFVAVLPPRSPLVQHSSLDWESLMSWDFVAR